MNELLEIFWTSHRLRLMIFIICFIIVLFELLKQHFQKERIVLALFSLMILNLVLLNSSRYVVTELVRANQYWAIDASNYILTALFYFQFIFLIAIIYFNRNWRALPLVLLTLTFPTIIFYSKWLSALVIWTIQ